VDCKCNLLLIAMYSERHGSHACQTTFFQVEEEEYTSRIIHYFNNGLLTLPEGATLRSYLSDKLNCDPMRVTKKYAGASCLGRRVYHFHNRPQPTVAQIQFAKAELDLLEQRFRQRVEEGRSGIPNPSTASFFMNPFSLAAAAQAQISSPAVADSAAAIQALLVNLAAAVSSGPPPAPAPPVSINPSAALFGLNQQALSQPNALSANAIIAALALQYVGTSIVILCCALRCPVSTLWRVLFCAIFPQITAAAELGIHGDESGDGPRRYRFRSPGSQSRSPAAERAQPAPCPKPTCTQRRFADSSSDGTESRSVGESRALGGVPSTGSGAPRSPDGACFKNVKCPIAGDDLELREHREHRFVHGAAQANVRGAPSGEQHPHPSLSVRPDLVAARPGIADADGTEPGDGAGVHSVIAAASAPASARSYEW
jgi:hypothetical protein